jgi:hypothetical protein
VLDALVENQRPIQRPPDRRAWPRPRAGQERCADPAIYDPVRRRVFACCGNGTLTVVRQDSADCYTVDEVVQISLRTVFYLRITRSSKKTTVCSLNVSGRTQMQPMNSVPVQSNDLERRRLFNQILTTTSRCTQKYELISQILLRTIRSQ